MRGLLIQEPWIGLILQGEKTWELRTQPTKIRGKIALIRSGSGLILGTAEIDDCRPVSLRELRHHQDKHQCPMPHVRKYADGRQLFAWVIKKARPYARPRPYTHPSGAVIWVTL